MEKESAYLISSRSWPAVSSPGRLLLLVMACCTAVPGAWSQQPVCDAGRNISPLCRCSVADNGERTVDCSGLDLVEVPSGIPDDTVILNLSNNSIEQIRSNDLSNLVNLRELYMLRNIIGRRTDSLDNNSFQNLQNLELLDLYGNRLTMTAESVTSFLPLIKLRHLDVGDNMLSTIDSAFLTIFDRLDKLFLVSNRLICDCSLLWFKNWLLNKSTQEAFTASGVQCFTPSSVSNQPVQTALFCIPIQRCYFCEQASSNGGCNFAQEQCQGSNPACQNEVRVNNGVYLISKQCQTLTACLDNARQNQDQCNSGEENSVCRYCCQGDKCNAPESAILANYQFPYPETTPATLATSTDFLTTATTHSVTQTTPLPSPTLTPSSPATTQTPPTTSVEKTTRRVRGRAWVCEGTIFFISCEDDGYIQVRGAFYGHDGSPQSCSSSMRTCGDAALSKTIVQERCQGENQCSFLVSNQLFTDDPCPNIYKYLFVSYYCIIEETPTPLATPTPVATTTPASVSTVRQTVTAASEPTLPTYCPVEVTQGETGEYLWPETLAGKETILPCPHGPEDGYATRTCENGEDGEETDWGEPSTSDCRTASSVLEELSNVTIQRDNALDVSEILTDVTLVADVLMPDDVTNVVNTFENLVNAINVYEEQSPDVLSNVLDAVHNLGNVPSEQLVMSQLNDDSASRLLSSIDSFNLGVRFPSNVLEEDTPSIDVAVVDITDPEDSGLLFFGSGRINGNSQPKVVTNASDNADDDITRSLNTTEPDVIVRGSIYMPNSLLRSVGTNLTRCQFVMHEESTFFDSILRANRNRTTSNEQEDEGDVPPTTGSEVTGDMTTPSTDCISFSCRPGYETIVNSVVISGAVGNQIIENLEEPVTIIFRKNRLDADNPRCVYWDEKSNDGWSTKGCRHDADDNDDENVVCKCDHLTNFAMLMDIYNDGPVIPEGHQIALSVISYVGCSLSLIGLVLTLITYTCCGSPSRSNANEKKFTTDKRAKVLVNFVISLILVNMFFIAGSLTAEYQESLVPELCTAMAVCLHYSLLVAMAWMAIQAFNMYMALVKVFATYYSHFLLKMILIGWGIPLIIVGITIGVDLDNYGDNSGLCWLGGISFYVAFLLPVCLVLVFNTVVFVAVTWKLCRLRKSKISTSDRFDLAAQMRASVSITVLLGLTWILGIFAIGEASLIFMYLFAAFNSLQGFSVFVFQCLLQAEMRKRWVKACCPYCEPDTADSKSGVYSTSRSQTNLVNKPNNNWRKGTQNTTLSSSYADNPTYEMSEN